MSTYIQNFKKFQPLLSELIARDIKIKYRKSVLGVLWTLLNPLFMMIILSILILYTLYIFYKIYKDFRKGINPFKNNIFNKINKNE